MAGGEYATAGKLVVNTLFPSFVYCRDHPDAPRLNEALVSLGERLRASQPGGRSISNRGGWQSDTTLTRYAECLPLIGFIEETMREVKEYLSAADEVHFVVTSCWMNINARGNHNATHIHGNSYFSGVYYVRVHKGAGCIQFREPCNIREYFSFPYKERNARNCFAQTFEPVAGRMFIFPAYLPHEVTANESDEERISVAFNILGEAR